MGVVYYANFLAFFESGRVEAMRQIDAEYSVVVDRGIHLPVVAASVRYLRPAVFDDLLLISTRADDVRGARFTFRYVVTRDSDNVRLAEGHTIHGVVDASSLRPIRMPEWLRAALSRLA